MMLLISYKTPKLRLVETAKEKKSPPLKILLCEDSEDDAILCERALRAGGIDCDLHRVWSKKTLEDALRGHRWDMALIDFYLPGYAGEEALKLCQEFAPEMPVIFVSGLIKEEQAIEALKQGATDYVLKNRLSRLTPAVKRAYDELQAR